MEGEVVSFLYDRKGNRKYLTGAERRAFLAKAALSEDSATLTFCSVLSHTGARLSEVLALTPRQFDFDEGVIVFRSLKRRRGARYRAVPVPMSLLEDLDARHAVRAAREDGHHAEEQIWPWGRTTGWQRVKDVMRDAAIHGPQATAKGLRHGFAVAALQSGIPLNVVSKWLGHAQLNTTAIYTEVVGAEERSFAEQMWKMAPQDRTGAHI